MNYKIALIRGDGIGFVDSQQQDMESLQPRKTEEPRQAS